MKYWTVQTKEVLDIINRDGVYNPKNTESRYVKENPSLLPLYNFFTMALYHKICEYSRAKGIKV